MEFVLFKKLAKLEGTELILLIAAAVVFIALVVTAVIWARKRKKAAPVEAAASVETAAPAPQAELTRALIMGALAVSLSFVLSYIKLFSMPMGGSITLCSMLPITMYACGYGRKYGFLAAFAYALLQVLQGAYIIHWAQFILDYFVAFMCLGLAAFFPRRLPLGVAVAGFARMLVSALSGYIFFADAAAEAGYSSAILYTLVYNASTIGVDTVLCVVVALLLPASLMKRFTGRKE